MLTEICKKASDFNYSYYDTEAYAYRERPEWIECFRNRNTRTFISAYLQSAKREADVSYRDSRLDAMIRALAAKAEHEAAEDKAFFEEIEAQVE